MDVACLGICKGFSETILQVECHPATRPLNNRNIFLLPEKVRQTTVRFRTHVFAANSLGGRFCFGTAIASFGLVVFAAKPVRLEMRKMFWTSRISNHHSKMDSGGNFMTQILIVCAVAMIICGGYTFLLPTYDWIVERRSVRTRQSPQRAQRDSATANRVT